jgi:hypothetical protein
LDSKICVDYHQGIGYGVDYRFGVFAFLYGSFQTFTKSSHVGKREHGTVDILIRLMTADVEREPRSCAVPYLHAV